jgi:hypothetical protein
MWMNTHLRTAHQYGVTKALEKCGYASLDEVTKEAAALGLVDAPAQAKTAAASSLGDVFKLLRAKLE